MPTWHKINVHKKHKIKTDKRMKRKTTPALHVRISDDARAMFDEIERVAHIRDSAITHAFVQALTEYWQKNKSIKLPFRIVNDEDAEIHEMEANGTIKTKTTRKK